MTVVLIQFNDWLNYSSVYDWFDDEVLSAQSNAFHLQQFASDLRFSGNGLCITELNIPTTRNKLDEFRQLLSKCKYDILAIAESRRGHSISNKELQIEQYRPINEKRRNLEKTLVKAIRAKIHIQNKT